MLGRMPVDHIVTLVRASGPDRAAAILASMPGDRLAALLDALTPAATADALLATSPSERLRILMTMSPERTAEVLAELSADEAAAVLASAPVELAVRVLLGEPDEAAAHVLLACPGDLRDELCARLREAGSTVPDVVYRRRVAGALGRLVPAVRPLPQEPDGYAANVFGRTVQVTVRVPAGGVLGEADVYAAACLADWSRVHGYVLVTDADPRAAAAYARSASAAGYPVEVVRWLDDRDDAGLKRAVVHVAR